MGKDGEDQDDRNTLSEVPFSLENIVGFSFLFFLLPLVQKEVDSFGLILEDL